MLQVVSACSNDPYPSDDQTRKVLYRAFPEAPKTLDPAVAYTTSAHAITGNIYEGLLEYDYVARPYQLVPALATGVPEAVSAPDGTIRYHFELRPGVRYADDACFELSESESSKSESSHSEIPDSPGSTPTTRSVTTRDLEFSFQRLADPAVASPIAQNFAKIRGFRQFSANLEQRRERDASFAARPPHEQYALVGGIEGVHLLNELELDLVLDAPYPQLLYWLAMPFTAPVPWEAVAYYDGEEGRPHFRDHPVGTGPFVLTRYNKQALMVLEQNPRWREWPQPAPGHIAPLGPRAGSRLPFIERVEYRREKEAIPAFGKFLQGYYDGSAIIEESFDRVIQEDQLSSDMAERGMRLEKSVEPGIYYLGFNMDDPVVGAPAGERGRKLRQAMSLVIDIDELSRLFLNGRGVPANSPVPPGLFGYDPEYRNPYREVDVERAKQLLIEAGYPGGIDAETGRPLKLGFDTPDTTSTAQLRSQFHIDAWRSIGIDVELRATTYNQFQEKMRNGAFQLFRWGWIADYPDPENFLFLLESSNGRTRSGGPNTANFSNAEYDALFAEMKDRPNDERRGELIREMQSILERERPWIELYHPEDYSLVSPWLENVKPFGMSYPMLKYYDIDPDERARLRAEWNQPIVWPAYALAGLSVLIVVPGIFTFFRERV